MISIRRHLPSTAGIDLHSHSWHSDGMLAPCEVARRMARVDVRIGALTDHDTMTGVAEFRREALRHGLAVLPGVELTCACADLKPLRLFERQARSERGGRGEPPSRPSPWEGEGASQPPSRPSPWEGEGEGAPVEVHLLVYGIEPGQPDFEDFMATIRAMRRERITGMLERLRSLGLAVEEESLAARLDTGSVGRPHLARLLVEAGHVRTVDEAFQRWLAEGRPAWLPKHLPEVAQALALTRRLGGVAVAAHPGQTLPAGAPLLLADLGVDGLEARHPGHRAARVQELHEFCRRNRLSATAGSDFHDPAQGRYRAPDWSVEQVGGRLQGLLEALLY